MKELRYPSLEGLRILSSVAIILYHFVPYMERGRRPSTEFWPGQFSIAVDLFFVVSGIVIANGYAGRINSLRDYGEFVRRRLARLYPLHLATLGFYALIGLVAALGVIDVVKESKYAFGELWANLLMVHAWGFSSQLSFNYVSWSISAEWFVYLIFPLLVPIVARPLGVVSVGIMFLAGVFASELWIGRSLPKLTWDYSILRALPGFALGVWIWSSRVAMQRLLGPRVASIGLAGSVAALTVLLLLKPNPYALFPAVYALVAFAFCCDLSRVSSPLAWRPLSDLGVLTYPLYMLHPVVATIFLSFLAPKLMGTSYWASVLSICIAIAVTFVLAHLSHLYFETPARVFITRWRPRKGPLAFDGRSTDYAERETLSSRATFGRPAK